MGITILGISVVDIIVKAVDKLPETGKLKSVQSISLCTGGCAVNSSIDLCKIGYIPTLITPIGIDFFGMFLKEELTKFNIALTGLVEYPSVNTSTSIVLSNSSGERSFLHVKGANEIFSIKDINYNLIKTNKILFIAGSFLMNTFDGKECVELLKKAKEDGIYTVLDTAYDDTGNWDKINCCFPYIDIFAPSYQEAKMIANMDNEDDISDFIKAKGTKIIIIKNGENGAYVNDNNQKYYVPAFKTKAIDTTGAGDSFMAGLLFGLYKGWTIHKSVTFGNAVGHFCVQEIGASNGLPDYQTIINFLGWKE